MEVRRPARNPTGSLGTRIDRNIHESRGRTGAVLQARTAMHCQGGVHETTFPICRGACRRLVLRRTRCRAGDQDLPPVQGECRRTRSGDAGVRRRGDQARSQAQVPHLSGEFAGDQARGAVRCAAKRHAGDGGVPDVLRGRQGRGVLHHHPAGHAVDARARHAAARHAVPGEVPGTRRKARRSRRHLVVDAGRLRDQGPRDHRTEERRGAQDARRRSDLRIDAQGRRRLGGQHAVDRDLSGAAVRGDQRHADLGRDLRQHALCTSRPSSPRCQASTRCGCCCSRW